MYEIKDIPDDWADMYREDLQLAKRAQEMGYVIYTKEPFDVRFGVPHDFLLFKKHRSVLWKIRPAIWDCADLFITHCKNHRSYIDLKEALETESL